MKLAIIFVLQAVAFSFDFTKKVEKTGIIFSKIGDARISYDSFTLLYYFEMSNYLQMTEKV